MYRQATTHSVTETDRQHYDAAMLMQYDQLKLTRSLSTLHTRKYKKENMFTWCSWCKTRESLHSRSVNSL